MNAEKSKSQKKLWAAIAIVLIIIIAIILFLLFNNGKEYTVTFDTNGGSASITEKVKNGKLVEEPVDPTREGYKFLGWYLDDEEFDFSTPIDKNLKLIAKWEKLGDEDGSIYNVKFDDGTQIRSAKTDENGYVKELTTPVKEGYKFLGWYLGDKKFDFSTPITEDMTLVAKWEKEEETSNPTETGKPSGTTKPTESTKPSGNTGTTTPQVQTYTVKFTVDGSVTSQTFEKGSKITLPAAPSKEGYTFRGWYSNGSAVSSNTIITGNMDVVAVWDTYTFEVELISNDKYSPNALVKTYKNGQKITATTIYGNINGNANYKLGKYSDTYSAIKIVSKEQFDSASSYKIEVDGNIVYASKN